MNKAISSESFFQIEKLLANKIYDSFDSNQRKKINNDRNDYRLWLETKKGINGVNLFNEIFGEDVVARNYFFKRSGTLKRSEAGMTAMRDTIFNDAVSALGIVPPYNKLKSDYYNNGELANDLYIEFIGRSGQLLADLQKRLNNELRIRKESSLNLASAINDEKVIELLEDQQLNDNNYNWLLNTYKRNPQIEAEFQEFVLEYLDALAYDELDYAYTCWLPNKRKEKWNNTERWFRNEQECRNPIGDAHLWDYQISLERDGCQLTCKLFYLESTSIIASRGEIKLLESKLQDLPRLVGELPGITKSTHSLHDVFNAETYFNSSNLFWAKKKPTKESKLYELIYLVNRLYDVSAIKVENKWFFLDFDLVNSNQITPKPDYYHVDGKHRKMFWDNEELKEIMPD